jgi:hypothetical protein
MIIPYGSRLHLLNALPNNNKAAEIGVFRGELSGEILFNCNPNELFLIDCWNVSENPDDALCFRNKVEGDVIYNEVLNNFSAQISSGQINIIRDYTTNCVDKFPDKFFDWIYLDADHTYEAVKRDLELFEPKIKDDGFILGHDYTNSALAQQQKFGVIEAVNEFVKKYNYHFLAATLHEAFPSYVLAKNYTMTADLYLLNLMKLTPFFILQINDFVNLNFNHEFRNIGGQDFYIASIN